MKKKLLASLLALCMLLSLLPATAFAADEAEEEQTVAEESYDDADTNDDADEADEAEDAEEAEEAEVEAPAEEPAIDTGMGFAFGPIISIQELKDKGMIPEDYGTEETEDAEEAEDAEETEDADIETGLVQEQVGKVEDVYDYDDDDDDYVAVPKADVEDEDLVSFTVPNEETEDNDPYAFETMSATAGGIKVSTANLVDHSKKGEDGKHDHKDDVEIAKGEAGLAEGQQAGYTINGTDSGELKPKDSKVEKPSTDKAEEEDGNTDETESKFYQYYELTLDGTKLTSKEDHEGLYPDGSKIEGNYYWIGLDFTKDASKSEGAAENQSESGAKYVLYRGTDEPGKDANFWGATGEKLNALDGALYFNAEDYTYNQVVWIGVDLGDGMVYYKVNLNFGQDKPSNDDKNPGDTNTEEKDPHADDDNSDDDSTPATGNTGVSEPETSGNTTTVEVTNGTSTSGTTASADISDSKMEAAVESAIAAAAQSGTNAEVKIELRTSDRADSLNVTLPAASLKTLAAAEGSTLAITSGVANVTLDHSALAAVAGQASGKSVTLEVAPVAADKLTDAQKAAVGSAKVVDVALFTGSTAVTDFGGGSITVTLPYTLAEGETAEDIVVWIMDDDGNLTPVTAVYVDGQLVITTTRLGKCVIGAR